MDAVALLRRAQEVGLRVEPIGDKLLVRGPKRAQAVVELLAAHKAEVLAALAATANEVGLLAPPSLEPGLEQPCAARRGHGPSKPSKPSKLIPRVVVAQFRFDGDQKERIFENDRRLRSTYAALGACSPEHVPADRWQRAVQDGRHFLEKWGEQAAALGWTPRDLFALHKSPDQP